MAVDKEILKAKNFYLFIDDEGKKPVACATNLTINLNIEIKEATKPQNSNFRSRYAGMSDYDITVEGLFAVNHNGTIISADEMLVYALEGRYLNWSASDAGTPGLIYSGVVLVKSVSLVSGAEGFHTFTANMLSDGPLERENTESYLLMETGDKILQENNDKIKL